MRLEFGILLEASGIADFAASLELLALPRVTRSLEVASHRAFATLSFRDAAWAPGSWMRRAQPMQHKPNARQMLRSHNTGDLSSCVKRVAGSTNEDALYNPTGSMAWLEESSLTPPYRKLSEASPSAGLAQIQPPLDAPAAQTAGAKLHAKPGHFSSLALFSASSVPDSPV